MDIREFVFRQMHGRTESELPNGQNLTRTFDGLRKSEIKNDPECREMCARFLYTEIFLQGREEIEDFVYDQNIWEPLAEHFITTILPSNTFMADAILFFDEIRQGKYTR